MKSPRHRALPHPLLSPSSGDVTPPAFAFQCGDGDITCDHDMWHITGTIRHECHDLAAYVDAGLASFGVHVDCPRTFYRRWFATGPLVRLALPADAVRGTVELLAMCVASAPIPDYHLAGQHADYRGATFDLGPGDLLAVAAHVEFDAYLDLDPIRKISSILDIRKSPDRTSGPAQLNFNGDRIEVELPQADYQSYLELRVDPSIRGVLSSNVVLPALLQAISHLGRLSPEELQEAKDSRRWCRSLMARLERARFNPDAGPEDVFRVAQDILRNPIRRSLTDLLGGAA